MKYTLKKPVKLGNLPEVTELTFREEVTAGDLRGLAVKDLAEAPTFEALFKIAGRLCAQPDAVVNALSMADATQVMGIVSGFLSAGQEIGTEP